MSKDRKKKKNLNWVYLLFGNLLDIRHCLLVRLINLCFNVDAKILDGFSTGVDRRNVSVDV